MSTISHTVKILEWDYNNSLSSFTRHMKAYQYIELVLIDQLVYVFVIVGIGLGLVLAAFRF